MQSDFQTCSVFGVVQQTIAEPKGIAIERAGGRHAHIPTTGTAGKILNSGLGAAGQYVDSRRAVTEAIQIARGHLTGCQYRITAQRAQIVQVGFAAIQASSVQGALQLAQRLLAGIGMHNHFGQHGIKVSGHFQSGLDPVVNADAVAGWENNFAEQAGAWLKVAERIFGIQTYLNRMTLRVKIASLCIQIRRITGGQTDHPLD